ncbi:MAG: hypothetical protein GY869_27755 [Planctomycetes bacterium]|nr:hypothetical protein [Planctomycetota bacterium]
MVEDAKGDKHLCWYHDVSNLKYGRIHNDRMIETLDLGESNRVDIKRDFNDRIYLCWGVSTIKLQVWDGHNWTDSLAIPIKDNIKIARIFRNRQGKIFVAYIEKEYLQIKEVLVDEK